MKNHIPFTLFSWLKNLLPQNILPFLNPSERRIEILDENLVDDFDRKICMELERVQESDYVNESNKKGA